ncbi:MAG: hypothetical protein ACI8XM_000933 [Haloarculaceae archaeon]|jgi:hypothetical protein
MTEPTAIGELGVGEGGVGDDPGIATAQTEAPATTTASADGATLADPTALTATATSTTTVELSWTDNDDHEDGWEVLRQRVTDDGTWPEEVIADLPRGTEAYTDDSAAPGTEYNYRVRTYNSRTSSTSGQATATTDSLGVPRQRTRRQDWTVEVVAPTGEVLRPELVATPQWQPETTGMPYLNIPVPDRPRWRRNDLLTDDTTTVRVWYRGRQLPIDSVVEASPEPGQVTLRCRGASDLDTYVASEQFDERETHLAFRDLIDAYTSYTHNIDDPDADTESDVEMLSRSTSNPSEFRDALAIDWPSDSTTPTDDTIPLVLDVDGLRTRQTCAVVEAEDATTNGTTYFGSELSGYNGEWSGGETIQLSAVGDYVEVSPSFLYTIPQNDLDAGFLFSVVNGDSPGIEISYRGGSKLTTNIGAFNEDADRFTTDYFKQTLNDGGSTGGGAVRFEVTDTNSNTGEIYLDLVAVYDNRFSYTFDASFIDESGAGPESFPAQYAVETVDTSSVKQVIGGRMTVTIDDTTNNQGLGVSNDQGTNWKRGSNTDDFSATFNAADQQIRGDITLSRHGSQTQTPTQGVSPQVVDSMTVFADLDDTPVLLDRQFSGDLDDILQEVADSGDFALEARRDPAASWDDPTGIVIEGTVAGQRTRSRVQEGLVDFSATATVEQSYDKVVVSGSSKAVRGEAFTASLDLLVGLDENWIVPGSETVYDPSDGTEFERGTDYVMDWEKGAVEALSAGSMQDGSTYEVDYQFTFRGSASSSGVSDPRTREVQVPSSSSDRECEQVALSILKRVQDPLETAEVTVSTDDPTVSLIDALSHPDLPLEGPLVIRSAEFQSAEVRYQLGSRQSFAAVVKEIQSQFQAIAKRV